jgi:hypothetical protein
MLTGNGTSTIPPNTTTTFFLTTETTTASTTTPENITGKYIIKTCQKNECINLSNFKI